MRAQIERGKLDHYWGSMPRLVQVLRSTRKLGEEQDGNDKVRHSAYSWNYGEAGKNIVIGMKPFYGKLFDCYFSC